MQKWEFSILRAINTDFGYTLTNVNNEYVAKTKGFKIEGPNLIETLAQMGQNGWEIVGMASEGTSYKFVLKRPIE
jgi:hypothetical protein